MRDAWILQQGKVRWDLNFSLFNSWSVNYYLKCTWRVNFSSVRAWNETRASPPPPPSLSPCCLQFSVAWKALSFISFLNRRLTSFYVSELMCYQIMQGGLFVWRMNDLPVRLTSTPSWCFHVRLGKYFFIHLL